MAYWDGSNEQYMEINTNSSDVEIPGVTSAGNRPSSYQIIRGPENDIFYLGRNGSNQALFHSYDDGDTWDNYTLNDQFPLIYGNANTDGSLALDSSGDLWIAWCTVVLGETQYEVVSCNVSIDDHVLTFSEGYEAVPWHAQHYAMRRPVIWIDINDRKHLTFDAGWSPTLIDPEVQYTYKDDGGWSSPVLISGGVSGRDYYYSNMATSINGSFIIVVYFSDVSEGYYAYYKGGWTSGSGFPGAGSELYPVVAYNDNEDKALIVYDESGSLNYYIFNFTDESLSPEYDVGKTGTFPDLLFDIDKNQALAIYDAGADGIEGIIYDFDTESWGSNFSIRDIDPGYIHTVSLAKIDIGGTGEPDEEWYAYDPDANETHGPFDDYDDVIDFIEGEDPDPEDPDPGGEWSTGPGGETGAFTRFRMRLWFMLIGFGCLFGPILFFAWRRPSGYYILCGSIVMLIGIGLLLSIGQV